MVQRTGKQSGQRVSFIQNNFFHDAFFLKAIGEQHCVLQAFYLTTLTTPVVLNGACNGLCVPVNASEPKYHVSDLRTDLRNRSNGYF